MTTVIEIEIRGVGIWSRSNCPVDEWFVSVSFVRAPVLHVIRSSFFGYFQSCNVQSPPEFGVRQRRLGNLQARQMVVGKLPNSCSGVGFEERSIEKFVSFTYSHTVTVGEVTKHRVV